MKLTPGTRVRFTADALGVLDPEGNMGRFADPILGRGDEGTYRGAHPTLPDWHLVDVVIEGKEYVVPVHPTQFEALS